MAIKGEEQQKIEVEVRQHHKGTQGSQPGTCPRGQPKESGINRV